MGMYKDSLDGIKRFRCLPDCGPIGGVCAGVGYWFALPTWLVRVAWLLVFFLFGFGALAYILLWIFAPTRDGIPSDYEERTGSNPT
jgi:phage shock protein PspC (stress-responsive transcriptional regulator)